MCDQVNPTEPKPEPEQETVPTPNSEEHPANASFTEGEAHSGDDTDPEPLEAEDAEEEEDDDTLEWKESLREQFEAWMESVDEISEVDEEAQAPDLYSLYEALVALRNENRAGNRKAVEVFGRFGESLSHFDVEMKRLREQWTRLEAVQGQKDTIPRSQCLALVEMLDRMQRLRAALERRPAEGRFGWLGVGASWKEAWENVRRGFSIVTHHLETLLERAGVTTIQTVGKLFDPVAMVVVETIPSPDRAANFVLEEVSPGYRWRDEVLRPAEVKISKSIE